VSTSDLVVHRLNSMKIANFFLLLNDGGLTLIDTGSKDEIENIRVLVEWLNKEG